VSSEPSGIDEGRLFAFLAYLLSIIGFLIVLLAKKDNKFAMFHAKQSLVLFFGWVISGVVWVLPLPLVGPLIAGVLYALVMILSIVGIIYALTGQETKLPVVGQIAEKFNI
jgi:uncharacterized membrane protein